MQKFVSQAKLFVIAIWRYQVPLNLLKFTQVLLKLMSHRMQIAQRQFSFTPSLIPTLAALVMVLLTLYLAIWQQGRATQKRALQAEFIARTVAPPVVISSTLSYIENVEGYRYRIAIARGEWVAKNQLFIDNKVNENGVVGYHVITPLKVDNGSLTVLVNRGWIARTAKYPLPPLALPPLGMIEVHGLLTIPSQRFLELSAHSAEGNVWQNLTIDRYRAATNARVLPFVLLATEATPPNIGLASQSERPDAGVEKHIEYMLTWYSLAATLVLLWVGLNFHVRHISPASAVDANTNSVNQKKASR